MAFCTSGVPGGNRPFIEAPTPGFTTALTNFTAKSFGRGWSGGALGRRLGPLRGGHPKDIVLKRRSATEPAVPTGYTIDPSSGDVTPGTDGFVLVTEPDPAGNDPLWNATVHNPVDEATGLYHTTIPDANWIIYPTGTLYRQEFTSDFNEPKTWTAVAPINTDYLETRIRNQDGSWSNYVVRNDSVGARTWTTFFGGNVSASPWDFGANFDWSQFEWNSGNDAPEECRGYSVGSVANDSAYTSGMATVGRGICTGC